MTSTRRRSIWVMAAIALAVMAWIVYGWAMKRTDAGQADQRLPIRVYAPQGHAPWEDNLFTKLIEDRFEVELEWMVAAGDTLKESRQMLLTGDDYPEVFLEGKFSGTELLVYGKQGLLLPLNDLIEQYAPHIQERLETDDAFREVLTAPDGNIYGIPRLNECYHCTYAQKYWMNQAWLDELGLDVPATTEELYDVLKAFKEQDPNGNGEQDEIPLTGAPNRYVWHGNIDAYLMNAFIYNDNDRYLLMEDGQVGFAPVRDAWREGLRFMHQLYAEGLIDPASFTQSDEALSRIGNREGDELVGSMTAALVSYLVNPYDPALIRHRHWTVVPPLQGPSGVRLAGASLGVAEFQFAITDKASPAVQEAVIRIADYTYSEEGSLYSEYGPLEGVGWRLASPGEVNIAGEQAKYSYYDLAPREPDAVVNESWSLMGPKNLSRDFRDLFHEGDDPLTTSGYGRRLAQATERYEPYAPGEVYPSSVYIAPEDVGVLTVIAREIKSYVRTSMNEFIIGSKSLDEDWDAYVQGFERLELDRYVSIYQAALDDMRER